MKLAAEEPKHALGKERPGTIKCIWAGDRGDRHYITILMNGHGWLSNPIEVAPADVETIARHWEENKRVSVTRIRSEMGAMKLDRGYAILPNLEFPKSRPNPDAPV